MSEEEVRRDILLTFEIDVLHHAASCKDMGLLIECQTDMYVRCGESCHPTRVCRCTGQQKAHAMDDGR